MRTGTVCRLPHTPHRRQSSPIIVLIARKPRLAYSKCTRDQAHLLRTRNRLTRNVLAHLVATKLHAAILGCMHEVDLFHAASLERCAQSLGKRLAIHQLPSFLPSVLLGDAFLILNIIGGTIDMFNLMFNLF